MKNKTINWFTTDNFKFSVRFLIVIISFSLLFYSFFFLKSFAQEIDSSSVVSKRQQLENELKKLEAQIENYRNTIETKQKQRTSLERDIAILDAQIAKIKAELKLINIKINQLNDDIGEKNIIISDLTKKIEKEKAALAEMIRKMNETSSNSLVEIILMQKDLSGYFFAPESLEVLQTNIQKSLSIIKGDKEENEREKEELENRRAEQLRLKTIQEMEQKKLVAAENEKKKILAITKGEEEKYKKYLNETQKSAATIRSQLFLLTGSPAIPFEKAVEYATLAWKATGVRPAFLLGVIREESNLGANVGTGNWKVDLAHSRCANQREAFIQITSELGFNPDLMPVSKRAWYGYCGGAMGPAQFMPTTWLLYKDRISAITGNNPPNPWNPKDAFVAAALLLKDNGAVYGNYNAERTAALKYLAGSNWKNSAYAFYGDDVMQFASQYQEMIEIISR